jgi:CBS domain-containing protein
MNVRSVTTTGLARAEPGDPLVDAATTMAENEIGCLPVFRGEELIGIVSERDLVRAIAEDADVAVTTVDQYMSTEPVTIEAEAALRDAAHRMLEAGVRHLPVTEAGVVIGMVSIRDVLLEEAWPAWR